VQSPCAVFATTPRKKNIFQIEACLNSVATLLRQELAAPALP
jgi:hypothetical protein